jgi:hypothetical protein
MAQKRSPFQPGRSETHANLKIGGNRQTRLSGGTDFLIARTGGDFNVPIKKAVWCNRQKHFKEIARLNGNQRARASNTQPPYYNTDGNGKSFKQNEKSFCGRELAWKIPGKSENPKVMQDLPKRM